MMIKTLQVLGATAALAFAANAETITEEQRGETLAWILAAYVSCDTAEVMRQDVSEELVRFEAEAGELLIAANILSETPQACGMLNGFGSSLIAMAADDMASFETEYRTLVGEDFTASVLEASADGEMPDGTAGQVVLAQSSSEQSTEAPVTAVASWTGSPSSVGTSNGPVGTFFQRSSVPMPSGSNLRTTSDYK